MNNLLFSNEEVAHLHFVLINHFYATKLIYFFFRVLISVSWPLRTMGVTEIPVSNQGHIFLWSKPVPCPAALSSEAA